MIDPRQAEIRISWVGGGPLVVRGRLAWLILKLAKRGELAEDLDRLSRGQLVAKWGDNGQVEAKTERTYHWTAEAT